MKGKLVSHREAMKSASQSWPTLKAKLVKKIERQRKKQIKLAVETPLVTKWFSVSDATENDLQHRRAVLLEIHDQKGDEKYV